MKSETFWRWGLGLALATLPLHGGCSQESAAKAAELTSITNTNSTPDTARAGITNAPSPEAAQQELEQAPGEVVSTPVAPPSNVTLTGPANEVVKLAQAGLDESVMLSFVTNSPHTFNLSSDAIIYLNDIGVPGTVVTAMIQHDQGVKESAANNAVSLLPSNPPSAAPETAPAYSAPGSVTETTEAPAGPPTAVEAPATPPADVNNAYTYFYDSLAPYGNWINIAGYGWCWQPTVVALNSGWRPYSDGGYWAYTDAGWYWNSTYSWGWAPFHYGRWFHHNHWGWCWAPDTVWGPAWVSWRYGDGYCGWAPLPPYACFTPGIGFTYYGNPVGFGFGFGLGATFYTFVTYDHFADHHWHRHCVPPHDVGHCFDHSRVANRIYDYRGNIHNEGVPVSRVAAASRRQIPRLHIRESADPPNLRVAPVGVNRQTIAVYRPNLPRPSRSTRLVGQGIRPNPELRLGGRPGIGPTPTMAGRNGNRQPIGAVNRQAGTLQPLPGFKNEPLPGGRQQPLPGFANKPMPGSTQPLPGFKNEPFPSTGNRAANVGVAPHDAGGRRGPPPARNPGPLIIRGGNRAQTVPADPQPGPRASSPPAASAPAQPAVPTRQLAPPPQNRSVVIIHNQPQPTVRPASPPPAQTQPPPQYQRNVPQPAPRMAVPEQRTFYQRAAPVQNHPPVQAYRPAPAPEPREFHGSSGGGQRSVAPAPAPSPQPAPQMQMRSAPVERFNAPAPSSGSGRGSGLRRDR